MSSYTRLCIGRRQLAGIKDFRKNLGEILKTKKSLYTFLLELRKDYLSHDG